MAYSPIRRGVPYRAPAGGWSGMNLEYVRTPVTRTITHRTNTTTVPNPDNPGSRLPPFSREDDGSVIGWPTCAGTPSCLNTDGQPRRCGPWLVTEILEACSSVSNNHNNFVDPTTTQTQTSCRGDYGWKGVQAVKVWHGRFGWRSSDDPSNEDDALGCPRTSQKLMPDDTKYCALSVSATWNENSTSCTRHSMTIAGAYSFASSVNKTSGVLSRSSVGNTGSVNWNPDLWGLEDCTGDDAETNSMCEQYYVKHGKDQAAAVGIRWINSSKTSILLDILSGAGNTTGIGLGSDETGIQVISSEVVVTKNSGDSCGGAWSLTDGENDAGSVDYSSSVLKIIRKSVVSYDESGAPNIVPTCQVDVNFVAGTAHIQRWQRVNDYEWVLNPNTLEYECQPVKDSNGDVVFYITKCWDETVTITNDTVTYECTHKDFVSAQVITTTSSLTLTLSNPYTSTEVNEQLDSLLACWDLADDVKLPWRTDAHTTICPLVMYNEVKTVVSPADVDTVSESYTDPRASQYDGGLIGSPSVSYPNFYWQYENWDVCSDGNGSPYWWIRSWGKWSSDSVVSPYATAWTNNGRNFPWGAQSLPTGAFFIGSAGVYAKKKWAETKLTTPSFSFGRPWGDDRLLVDETNLACIESYQQIDNDKVLRVGSIPFGITASTPVAIVGVDGVDIGSYTVAPYNGSTTQLKITSGPLHYPVGSDQYGRAYIAPIRFPACPGIQGRVNVVGVIQGDDVITISVDRAIYLFTSGTENVQITGITGLASGTYAATRLTATSFSIPGTLSTAWQSGGYIFSPGAASYAWDDNGVKGDAVLLDYGFNQRDVGEYERLAGQGACGLLCNPPGTAPRAAQAAHGMPAIVSSMTITPVGLISTPCGPKVMAFTPNAEAWGGGVVRGIPQIALDEKYGIRWQGVVLQWVDDPLWQAPSNCGGCTMEEDAGGCSLDTCTAGSGSVYYPHRPVFEAMADIPDGAPATWRDHIHILGLSEIAAGTDGVVLTPPEAVGPGLTVAVPASIYAAAQGCVCANGRFKSIYTTQFNALCGS